MATWQAACNENSQNIHTLSHTHTPSHPYTLTTRTAVDVFDSHDEAYRMHWQIVAIIVGRAISSDLWKDIAALHTPAHSGAKCVVRAATVDTDPTAVNKIIIYLWGS